MALLTLAGLISAEHEQLATQSLINELPPTPLPAPQVLLELPGMLSHGYSLILDEETQDVSTQANPLAPSTSSCSCALMFLPLPHSEGSKALC